MSAPPYASDTLLPEDVLVRDPEIRARCAPRAFWDACARRRFVAHESALGRGCRAKEWLCVSKTLVLPWPPAVSRRPHQLQRRELVFVEPIRKAGILVTRVVRYFYERDAVTIEKILREVVRP